MAVMKKKGNKSLPPISTASLPDVIFMILFFFMVSTTMRDQELLVRYKLPEATEVQKLEKKSLVSYIHIGQPSLVMQAKFGTAPRIQLNDSYKTTKDILDFVAAERDKLSEADRASMTICLKADQTTKMGIVTDVKQELRRANALKVSYAASKSLEYKIPSHIEKGLKSDFSPFLCAIPIVIRPPASSNVCPPLQDGRVNSGRGFKRGR